MTELLPTIRNTVRAVIIRDDCLLLLRKEYEDGRQLFALPGGGQETGESLDRALRRECLEEIGTKIEIHDLLHVAELVKDRQTTPPTTRHCVELLFRCSVPKNYVPRNGKHPDKHQVDVVWVAKSRVSLMPFVNQSLKSVLCCINEDCYSLYVGMQGRQ